jgi:hypothetical protein
MKKHSCVEHCQHHTGFRHIQLADRTLLENTATESPKTHSGEYIWGWVPVSHTIQPKKHRVRL